MANLKSGTLIGGNLIWNAGNMPLRVSEDNLYINDSQVYTTSFKPTPAAIGAINKAGDTGVGDLTLATGKILSATLTHRYGYMQFNPYSSLYGTDGDRSRVYFKMNENGKPDVQNPGFVFSANKADGTNVDLNIWLNGKRVYHQGFKPTAADVNAVNKSGDTMTGKLVLNYPSSVKVPVGTTAQRATGVAGDFRFNTDETSFEGYDGAEWQPVGSGRVKFIRVSANTTASKGKGYLVDTTKSNIVVTLPTEVKDSDFVVIGDGVGKAAANKFYIAGFNGDRIIVDRDNCMLKFSYVVNKWVISDGIGEVGALDISDYINRTPTQTSGGNIDFNNYVRSGFYNIYKSIDTSVLNAPETSTDYGTLTVCGYDDNNIFITQTYTRRSDGKTWIRTRNDGSKAWTAWQVVYTSGNKPSAAELNVVNKAGDTMTGYLTARAFTASNSGAAFTTGKTTDGTYAQISAESGYVMLWQRSSDPTKASQFIGMRGQDLIFRQDAGGGDGKYRDWRVYHQGFKPTAGDVGLPLVQNWNYTDRPDISDQNLYATAKAVNEARTLAFVYSLIM